MISEILELANKAAKESEQSIIRYKAFKEYIEPLVRDRFNLPRYEYQYTGMCSLEIQKFVEMEKLDFVY